MLRIGQRVKIKPIEYFYSISNDKEFRGCPSPGFNTQMSVFCNKVAIITRIPDSYSSWYKIDLDGSYWTWSEDFLYPIHMINKRKIIKEIVVNINN